MTMLALLQLKVQQLQVLELELLLARCHAIGAIACEDDRRFHPIHHCDNMNERMRK
jgi:hypothetical protein